MTDPTGPTPAILELSHRYGADPAFVLAGGGNTSSKTPATLFVKASGHALATIGADGFVALDRIALDAMLAADWPDDAQAREALFLSRVMSARRRPDLGQRPSVEALLHHLLPDTLVVHTHPSLVNAVTCCTDGRRLVREWFGDDVLWQPYVDPGLVLAKALRDGIAGAPKRPAAVFLENHGLIVAARTPDEIAAVSNRVIGRIADELAARPPYDVGRADALKLAAAMKVLATVRPDLHAATDASDAVAWLAGTPAGRAAALAGPLTPDQIVYCRSVPLWLDRCDDADAVAGAWAAYGVRFGVEPWVVLVQDVGVVALRESAKLADTTRLVYADAAAVSRDACRLGGVRALSAGHRRFIEEWEVEAYRRSIAAKSPA